MKNDEFAGLTTSISRKIVANANFSCHVRRETIGDKGQFGSCEITVRIIAYLPLAAMTRGNARLPPGIHACELGSSGVGAMRGKFEQSKHSGRRTTSERGKTRGDKGRNGKPIVTNKGLPIG